MQIDLFVVADAVPVVPRAALSSWIASRNMCHAVLREWPDPHLIECDLNFSGELVLAWPEGHVRANHLWQSQDLLGLIRLNYDMEIEGALLAGFVETEDGVIANVQPHGGAGLFYAELAEFIASFTGNSVFDPILQDQHGQRDVWRRVFDGSLRNPAHEG